MALMTMIARTVDGLPLVGTMQESEEVSELRLLIALPKLIQLSILKQSGKSVLEYQNQAKMLFRKLGPN